jgi:hypothetical protein
MTTEAHAQARALFHAAAVAENRVSIMLHLAGSPDLTPDQQRALIDGTLAVLASCETYLHATRRALAAK